MKSKITASAGALAIVSLATFLTVAPRASAQSSGRVDERLGRDSTPPNFADFSAYMAGNADDTDQPVTKGKTIKSIKKLLKRGSIDKSTKLKILVRLAQLYRDKADGLHKEALDRYRKDYAQAVEKGASEMPVFDNREELAYLQNAADTLRKVTNEYGAVADRYDATLNLGMILARLGNDNGAMYLEQLAKADTAGTNTKAHLALAECKVAAKDYTAARAELKKIGEKSASNLKKWTAYRTAWLDLLDVPKDQLATARERAEASLMKIGGGKIKDGDFDLAREARKDLIAIWAEANNDSRAEAFFAKVKDDESLALTYERSGRLALARKDQGRAVEAFERLLAKAPNRITSIPVRESLLDIEEQRGEYDNLFQGLQTLQRLAKAPGDLGRVATNSFARVAFQHAQSAYKASQKPDQKAALAAAVKLLDLVVKALPDHPKSLALHVELADAAERLPDPRRAAEEYLAVANHKDSDEGVKAKSARKAVDLQRVYIASLKIDDPQTPAPSAIDLPTPKKTLVTMIDALAKLGPNDPTVPARRLEAAKITLAYGHKDDATTRYTTLVRLFPAAPEALPATVAVSAIYRGSRAWDQLVPWARELLGKAGMAAQVTALAKDDLRTGLWERSADLAKAKKYKDAADAFLVFQKEFPADSQADEAADRATDLRIALGDGNGAQRAAAVLIETYPKSARRADALKKSGETYRAMGQYESAGQRYEKLAREYAAAPGSDHALLTAADLYLAGVNTDAAVSTLRFLAAPARKSPEAPKALLHAARIEDDIGSTASARAAYAELAKRFATSNEEDVLFARVRVAVIDASGSSQSSVNELAAVEKRLVQMPKDHAKAAREALAKRRVSEFASHLGVDETVAPNFATIDVLKDSVANIAKLVATAEVEVQRIDVIGSCEDAAQAHYTAASYMEKLVTAMAQRPEDDNHDNATVAEMGNLLEKQQIALRAKVARELKAAATLGSADGRWHIAASDKLARYASGKKVQFEERSLEPLFIGQKVTTKLAH